MKKMEVKEILFFIALLIVIVLIANFNIYSITKSFCEKSEIKPVRYEYIGLFHQTKILIPTIPEKADSYEKICVKTGNPKFWNFAENIKYVINKTKSEKNG